MKVSESELYFAFRMDLPEGAELSRIDLALLVLIANVLPGFWPAATFCAHCACVCEFVAGKGTPSPPFFLLQYIESPDVEKEVKRLLSTDAEAVSVRILFMLLKQQIPECCAGWNQLVNYMQKYIFYI